MVLRLARWGAGLHRQGESMMYLKSMADFQEARREELRMWSQGFLPWHDYAPATGVKTKGEGSTGNTGHLNRSIGADGRRVQQ